MEGSYVLKPLWCYTLNEAELQTEVEHIEGVGGQIVGEVLIGIIKTTQKVLYPTVSAERKPKYGKN